MSIVVAIKRKNEIVIGADTQNSFGSMKLTAKHVFKLFPIFYYKERKKQKRRIDLILVHKMVSLNHC